MHSQEEARFLLRYMKIEKHYWIAGRRLDGGLIHDGKWIWTDATSMCYKDFCYEPRPGMGDCIYMGDCYQSTSVCHAWSISKNCLREGFKNISSVT